MLPGGRVHAAGLASGTRFREEGYGPGVPSAGQVIPTNQVAAETLVTAAWPIPLTLISQESRPS